MSSQVSITAANGRRARRILVEPIRIARRKRKPAMPGKPPARTPSAESGTTERPIERPIERQHQ